MLAKVNASLGPMIRKGTGIPDHPKLKRALGLSSRRTLHHWTKAGASTQLPGYATNIEGVARAARYMKTGGYVGIGLAIGATGMRIEEACRAGNEGNCTRSKFIEGGKLAGSVSGGVSAGYAAGQLIKFGVCAAIGVETAGVGGIVCALIVSGAIASVAGTAGAEAGGELGEKLFEIRQQ